MITRTRTILLALICGLILTAATVKVLCPDDDSSAYFTGKTRTNDAGKLLKQYKCYSYGHLFWVKA